MSDGLLHDAWPHDASCCHAYICKPCSRGIIMRTTHGHAMHRAIKCIYACCSRGIIMRTADGHAIHRGNHMQNSMTCSRGEKCLGHRLPSCGPPVNKWEFTGHQYQIPFVWATRNRYPLDGPPVSDTLVGSHQCQHPSNLASITAFTT